jgi:hypothetical protein
MLGFLGFQLGFGMLYGLCATQFLQFYSLMSISTIL